MCLAHSREGMAMTPTDPSQTRRHTTASVAEILRKTIEPDSAEEALTALKKLDGQPITQRLLDKLPGGRVEWRLNKQLGDTELRNRAYTRAKRDGVCLTLARNSETVSAAFVEQAN